MSLVSQYVGRLYNADKTGFTDAVTFPFYLDRGVYRKDPETAFDSTKVVSSAPTIYFETQNIDLRQVVDFNFYLDNSDVWTISYVLEDTHRAVDISAGWITDYHGVVNVPADLQSYRVRFTLISGGLSSEEFQSSTYKIRTEDESIEKLYFTGNLLTEGLTKVRKQNLPTEGLAFNKAYFIDSDFSLRNFIPAVYYDNDNMEQLLDFFEEAFEEKFNITKQLKIFNSVYDNIVLDNIKNYGMIPDVLDSKEYIKYNLLKNRIHLQDLHYIWAAKGTIHGLQGALKLFGDIYSFSTQDQGEIGWYLTESVGGIGYRVFDLDLLHWGGDSTAPPSGDDTIVYGIDALESLFSSDFNFAVKLNYYIDVWDNKQFFYEYDDIAALRNGYDFGDELIDTLAWIAYTFSPLGSKVYFYWINNAQTRVNIWTTESQ